MRRLALIAVLALAACKPPPTDADLRRAIPEAAPIFASEPLPSPDIEGAVWTFSTQNEARLIYGIPGQPALMALECLDDGALPQLQITRISPADEGAGAMLALVGNGHIGRMEVDAVEVGGRIVWQGTLAAAQTDWEPLAGPRQLTATVPGAGMVTLNPSALPGRMIEACRFGEDIDPVAVLAPDPGQELDAELAEPSPAP